MMYKKTMASLAISTLLSGTALAAVSPEEAARLGKDLTPWGGEMAGNADGSIPPWNPEGTPIPADFVAGSDNYIDPYADEKPLYTIDGNNWKDYADVLTEGAKGMFEKYGADGFKMHVYPTKRDYVNPDWMYENIKKNATGATLVADGQKVEGSYPGTPFPFAANGLEAIWNHMVRYITPFTNDYQVYYVSSDGKAIMSSEIHGTIVAPMFEKTDQIVADDPWIMLRLDYSAPARRAGEILLVHEPGADYTEGKGRSAWQYLTGQRRVRLAPAVSFDTPQPAVAGTAAYDDAYIFNGSPERYNWKLVGKKEFIVPYSNYRFVFQKSYDEVLGEKFLNPDMIRWEKHRMWIVEADLKEGARHLYSKRRFYLDEDGWIGLASESYDGQGKLWRVQFAYPAHLYDIKANFNFAHSANDLLQGLYNLNTKPAPGKFKNGSDERASFFTPKGMARGGVR